MTESRTYHNPVKRGFFPDPSVVRVGEDFYMVNSSFEYFPAIPVLHSRDLVNWEIIGHGITDPDYIDLADIDDSHGFWAPDISYHNGTYYIFATLRLNGAYDRGSGRLVHRQMIITSKKPEGPYSWPRFIEHEGIDPSHFVDDDGKHYMILSGGAKAIPLDDECTKAGGLTRTVWPGTGERCPEGPHILRKDSYYYAILAEGGTGYGHRISVARSNSLFGEYEESPYNPVLMQKDPSGIIQRTGHGKLVDTPAGDWWCLYLCGRPNIGNYTTLGRETALDPVRWTEDGWFTINNGKGPSTGNAVPDLPWTPVPETGFDDFDNSVLPLHWHWARNPDNSLWSLTERPGYLRLKSSNTVLGDKHLRNLLCRREEELTYTAVVSLEFTPEYPGEEAGIVQYWGIYSWIKCVLAYDNGPVVRLVQCTDSDISEIGIISSPAADNSEKPESDCKPGSKPGILLKTVVAGQRRDFFTAPATDFSRIDSAEWVKIGGVKNAAFLAGESISRGKAHTGTMFGLYASSGGSCQRRDTDFDWVYIKGNA